MNRSEIIYFLYSESGKNHENEDFISVQKHPENSDFLICALADGQGGQAGGKLAAQIAVENSIELAKTSSVTKLSSPNDWNQIIYQIDEIIADTSEAGFTTLVSFGIFEDFIYGASCGDSAVWLIDDFQANLLTEKQRKNPPVGSSAAFPISFTAKLQNNWKVLAMSDGVWKYIYWETIVKIAGNYRENNVIEELKRQYIERNGENLFDDFSLILLHQK